MKFFNNTVLTLVSCMVAMTALNPYSSAQNLSDAEKNEMRLIDQGDGNPHWVKFSDALKMGDKAHESGRCGGYFDLTDQLKVSSESLPMVEMFRLDLSERPLTQQAYLSKAIPQLDPQRIFKTVSDLSAFKNRYFKGPTGVKSSEWFASQFKALAKNRNDIKVDLFKHTQWDQPSVIVTVQGQGAKANEIVVIGGHADSINQGMRGSPEMVAPGADDNASGIGTVLEIFRVLVETGYKPNRTMMFMGYAAEEVGLRGSQDIANQFKQQGKTVVAVAQFDMVGFPGSGDQIVFINDFVNADLTKFSQKLVDTYVKVKWSNDRCGYACSDHASWTRAGYPSIFPFESTMSGDNKDIHSTRDLIQKLDFKHGLHYAKLGLSFMAELSQ